ncbi:MAG: biopolymer transport protein ExbD [Myxococcota bacterium]
MKLDRTPRPIPQLNLSPLIDVIFILLIFVVLVARFVDQERLDVTLPSAGAGRPAEIDALWVVVTEDGVIGIEDQIVPREELEEHLRTARRRYGRAVLMADEGTDLQIAVDVLSMAKMVGFEGVALATRPPE